MVPSGSGGAGDGGRLPLGWAALPPDESGAEQLGTPHLPGPASGGGQTQGEHLLQVCVHLPACWEAWPGDQLEGGAVIEEFLFDHKEWKDTLDRLSPRSKLYWRENYEFAPSIGWVIRPLEIGGKTLGKGKLGFNPEINTKGGKSPRKPTKELSKELEDAIAFTMADRGWLPRDDFTVNNREVKSPPPLSHKEKGFVYLVRNGDLYKIGITTDLKRRLSELKPDEVVNTVKRSGYAEI